MNCCIIPQQFKHTCAKTLIDAHRPFQAILESQADFSGAFWSNVNHIPVHESSYGKGAIGFGGRLFSHSRPFDLIRTQAGNWKRPSTMPGTVMSSSSSSHRKA